MKRLFKKRIDEGGIRDMCRVVGQVQYQHARNGVGVREKPMFRSGLLAGSFGLLAIVLAVAMSNPILLAANDDGVSTLPEPESAMEFQHALIAGYEIGCVLAVAVIHHIDC